MAVGSQDVTEGSAAAGRQLDPRARTMWQLIGVFTGVVIGIAAAVGLLVLGWSPVAGLLLGLVVAGWGWAYAHLGWKRWRWEQVSEALELRHGVVVHKASYIPYGRIQQIDIERGPIERLFGLTHLVVHTASATTDASIPGLDVADARALRQHLLERAGVDDAV